jgi:hypothetical protein
LGTQVFTAASLLGLQETAAAAAAAADAAADHVLLYPDASPANQREARYVALVVLPYLALLLFSCTPPLPIACSGVCEAGAQPGDQAAPSMLK